MESKVCTTCKQEKQLSNFHKHQRHKDGLASQCKNCRKDYAVANAEAINEKYREYRAANKDKRAEHNREYYDKNREALSQAHRQRRIENIEAYKARGRESKEKTRLEQRQYEKKRRALKRGTVVETVSYREVLKVNGPFCYLCGEKIAPGDLHFDHVIPLSRGGSHTFGNIKPAHASCNMRKHNKLLEELAWTAG